MTIVFFLLSWFLSFCASKFVSSFVRNKTLEFGNEIERKIDERMLKKISSEQNDRIEESTELNSLSIAQLYGKESDELRWVTLLIGFFEFAFFYFLFLGKLEMGTIHLKALEELFPIIGGWIAIKVAGNFSQWSNPLIGRALYYSFLLGTTVNIGLTFFFAYIFLNLTSKI